MNTFKNLTSRVVKVGKKFPNKWNVFEHYTDLVEEIGELGNALLVDSGKKSEKRRRAELKDSFADILFELILFAEEAGVNLEDELEDMLNKVEERLGRGEYEHAK